MLVEFCKGLSEIAFAAGLDGFHENCVRIVVVENHDVLGDAARGMREATGMVAENPSGYGHHFGENNMGSYVGIVRDGRSCNGVWWRNGGGGWRRFGGADVLAILV